MLQFLLLKVVAVVWLSYQQGRGAMMPVGDSHVPSWFCCNTDTVKLFQIYPGHEHNHVFQVGDVFRREDDRNRVLELLTNLH